MGLVYKNGNNFIWPQDFKNTNITYTMPVLNSIGQKIKGTIFITKNNFTETVDFSFTKVSQDKFDVDKVKMTFSNIKINTKKSHIAITTPTQLDNDILNSLGEVSKEDKEFNWPTDTLGTNITYTIPNVDNFNNYKGKIIISKNGSISQVDFDINKISYNPFSPALGSKITNGRKGKIFKQKMEIYISWVGELA